MSTATDRHAATSRAGVTAVSLAGAGVAVALGVYAKVHSPAGRPLFTLGFSGMLQMKAWLSTAAVALLVVQLVTALWMWGRLPGVRAAPPWGALCTAGAAASHSCSPCRWRFTACGRWASARPAFAWSCTAWPDACSMAHTRPRCLACDCGPDRRDGWCRCWAAACSGCSY